ncbi:hypothetical protein [Amycolatopsis sp. cmx-4-54]|uniref:hypothetical protein n=1 Tax=Amycolatopsis sp. cmx-4-54 TaxID=2790936 RepID=UPI00397D2300
MATFSAARRGRRAGSWNGGRSFLITDPIGLLTAPPTVREGKSEFAAPLDIVAMPVNGL